MRRSRAALSKPPPAGWHRHPLPAGPVDRTRRYAALAELRLVGEVTLDAVLRQVVAAATDLLPATLGASIVLWDPGRQEFTVGATTVADPESVSGRSRRSDGATRWIVDQQQPLVVTNTHHDPFVADGMIADGVRSYAGVPVVAAGETLGVLYVLESTVRRFDDDDLSFLAALARRAAAAVVNARRVAALEAAHDRAHGLAQLARVLIDARSAADVTQAVGNGVGKMLGASRVLFFTLDHESCRVVDRYVGGADAEAFGPHSYEELMEGLTGWCLRERRPALSPREIPDPRESPQVRERRRRERHGSIIVAPLLHRGTALGTLTAIRDEALPDFDRDDLELLETIAAYVSVALVNARLMEELQDQARTDELTGLWNRRALFDLAGRELKVARRTGRPLAALMVDVDRFKDINDRHGHDVGDEVLKSVAQRCRLVLREIDILGRFAGDELAVLLPGTAADGAVEVAERMRRDVGEAPVLTRVGDIAVSLSVGVAEWQHEQDVLSLLVEADGALLAAKGEGKNRVRVAERSHRRGRGAPP